MKVYIGVDFHARKQTVCYLTTEDGEIHIRELNHEKDDVKGFYLQFVGEVIVGLESGAYSEWFEDMLEELGAEVWVGDAAKIRQKAPRRQKSDKLDASLILDLMLKGNFPKVHRQSKQSRMVLKQVRYRHRIVKMRTMAMNSIQAMAVNSGKMFRRRLYTSSGRKQLATLKLPDIMVEQAEQLIKVIDELTTEVKRVEEWLKEQARTDERVMLLQTHPGIGLLTSLVMVHTLCPVDRFSNSRKVTAYLGLDPVEDSSGNRVRIGSISKQGSRLARFLVIEAGQVAIRKDALFRTCYQRLAQKRGKPKAKVAIGRRLIVRCFIMLRDGIDYDEFLRRGRS